MTPRWHLGHPNELLAHGSKRFHFPSAGSSISYAEVHERARAVARALVRRGLRQEELVGLLFGTCPEFLVALFGVLMGGGAIAPLPLPPGMRAIEAYAARLRHIVGDGGMRFVIASDDLAASAALVPEGVSVLRIGELLAEAQLVKRNTDPWGCSRNPHHLALVQYTSGSTSEPKGVALSHANVSAGLAAIVEGIGAGPDDVNGQWLPLHHDMGLIGLLAGIVCGVTHHLWSPLSFIRRPGAWLAEFAARHASIYAGPSFSYASMLAKTSDEQLAALDLSAWRIAFNGAELIDPACMESFTRRFARAGFAPETMFPVYGLAEATLAVTFPQRGAMPVVDWVSRARLAARQLAPAQRGTPDARGLVCVGAPVAGHQVRVTDDEGRPCGAGAVGQIEVRGPAVMASYWKKTPAESGVSPAGWFKTGDLGALVEGRLRVCGRVKEMIIVRGANFYPQDVEGVVGRLPGIHQGRVVAFAVDEPGAERIVVLAEMQPGAVRDLPPRACEKVLAELGLSDVQVIPVPPRSIAHTTSGKLQRLLMRDRYLSGALDPVSMQPHAA